MRTPNSDGIERPSRRTGSIVRLHYLFALLTLATLGASLWLTQTLSANYSESLGKYREWAGFDLRASDISKQLSSMQSVAASAIDAQGGAAVRQPREIPFERIASLISTLRKDVGDEAIRGYRTVPRILALLSEAERAARFMRTESAAVIAAANANDDRGVHAHWSAMVRAQRIAVIKVDQ